MLRKKRTHPLNRLFFENLQEQCSKAPGFKPVFSYEDFQKMLQMYEQLDKEDLENKET